jgi:hypothetical protein
MTRISFVRSGVVALLAAVACAASSRAGDPSAGRVPTYPPFPAGYRCAPFHDARYTGGAQSLPGRLQNEYYDALDVSDAEKRAGAGEGACYHDTDNKNSGSGAGSLNGIGTYENEFRMAESPDISYVKLHHAGVPIDDSPYNRVAPDSNALYLGWIAPGEWVRYTVSVTRAGWYSITTTYTSKFGGHVSLDVNGTDATGPLTIPSTFAAADTIEWRQAHHWNRVAGLGRFYLPAGRQLLTLHFIDQPVMNFDYMDFVRVP